MYKIAFLLLFFSLHFHAQSWDKCRYAFLHLEEGTIKQLLLAEDVLNKSLSDPQILAIIDAHNIGIGEPGKNGAPAGIANYTNVQLLIKTRILKQAGFTREEIRSLMEKEVVGVSETENRVLNGEPSRSVIDDMAMAEMGLRVLNEKFLEISNEELSKKILEPETKRKIDKVLSQMEPEEIIAILLYYKFQFDLKDNFLDRNNNLSWEIMTSSLTHNHLFLNKDKPVPEALLLKLLPYVLMPIEQIQAIPPDMIRNIPPNMMKKVSPFFTFFMTNEQIQATTPDQIKEINPKNMRYFLTLKRIEIMTYEQLQAVTSEQKNAMPLESVEAIRSKEMNELLSQKGLLSQND